MEPRGPRNEKEQNGRNIYGSKDSAKEWGNKESSGEQKFRKGIHGVL